MSDSVSTQYGQIFLRRGLHQQLPGAPSGGSTPTQGLGIGEPGYVTDYGQLFIGIDPNSGLMQLNRSTYPYNNIEVLTENSFAVIQSNFDLLMSDTALNLTLTGSVLSIPRNPYLVSDVFAATNTWTNVTIKGTPFYIDIPTPPTGAPNQFSLGNAQIYYYIFDTLTNNPIKTGIISVVYNGSGNPSLVDDGHLSKYLIMTNNPNVAYGGLQFMTVNPGGSSRVVLQYYNAITTVVPQLYFRIERALV